MTATLIGARGHVSTPNASSITSKRRRALSAAESQARKPGGCFRPELTAFDHIHALNASRGRLMLNSFSSPQRSHKPPPARSVSAIECRGAFCPAWSMASFTVPSTDCAARMAGTKTGLFSGLVDRLSAKNPYHRTTTPPHHLWQTNLAPMQGRVVFLPSSYLWKIITVLMRAVDGSVTLRQDGMRATNHKNRAGGGLGGHFAGFHEAYTCIGVVFISSNTSRLKMGNYSVSIVYVFPACNSVIRTIFMIEPIAPQISHRRGGRE